MVNRLDPEAQLMARLMVLEAAITQMLRRGTFPPYIGAEIRASFDDCAVVILKPLLPLEEQDFLHLRHRWLDRLFPE